jgi:PLP dependent protein
MPPAAGSSEQSRAWFRRLRELAAEHGLRELSMGTTQDFAVAAQEGATFVRVGSILFRD